MDIMGDGMNIKINKPIQLKMCAVNEEYEIDDTEELLKEAYEKFIAVCDRGNYDITDYKKA